jgi:hypothetical protein
MPGIEVLFLSRLVTLPTELSGLTSMPQLRMLSAILPLPKYLHGDVINYAQVQFYRYLQAVRFTRGLFAVEPRNLPHSGAAIAETSLRVGQAINRSPGIK